MADTISIYLVEQVLLVTIPDNITDTEIVDLLENLSERIVGEAARGVVIDIASLEIVDTFVGRVLAQLSSVAGMLGARTYVVGMRPAVAMTLVELDMDLPGCRMALSLTQALRELRRDGLA
ncbi:STAS domain-containing protein [Profundibacterium mesophilum]|uniref:Anti-sigma factor antagonist n=1 Tax=Profundibacterium mesophilum KAUST100406-0324 TaxID=1037889 RepID=A0A921TC55_9RHOB|nr:STAS domain-containing protein [Profundibacterium mesophilum]KAF0676680.1 Anti-sigma factor antagonist [Profundibacterium mesophilum KAUST100406-0324]